MGLGKGCWGGGGGGGSSGEKVGMVWYLVLLCK